MLKNPILIIFSVLIVVAILLVWKFYFTNKSEPLNLFERVAEQAGNAINEAGYISPISIEYLRNKNYEGSDIVIEQTLSAGSNYKRYVASYKSDGYKIYGLLTIPNVQKPEGGYPAIVFNHGYIPPSQYKTTEKYIAYVDYLARNGFAVFKIDMRGHGNSEGLPTGSYFSNAYTVDAINALKSLQRYPDVNKERIGIWGHSMSGNVTLRAMLVESDFKAGVIWGGAVYSYKDFLAYGISDNSYVRTPTPTLSPTLVGDSMIREQSDEIKNFRNREQSINFDSTFWKSISLTSNLNYLNAPLQLDHAENDDVVNVNYAKDLANDLKSQGKTYKLNIYPGGGHNINSPYFEQAMKKTVEFYAKYL